MRHWSKSRLLEPDSRFESQTFSTVFGGCKHPQIFGYAKQKQKGLLLDREAGVTAPRNYSADPCHHSATTSAFSQSRYNNASSTFNLSLLHSFGLHIFSCANTDLHLILQVLIPYCVYSVGEWCYIFYA